MVLSSFVGRDGELAELARLVDERQLVTVTGPGGAGKTRLARALASRWNATWFADLSGTTADGVADTIGAALGDDVVPSLDALAAAARRRSGLLVLDNLEHLPDIGPAVASLAEACPDLRVLVTSRAPLRVTGESVYEVPPLGQDDAVRLFVERAADAGAAVDDLGAVADICRQLDGLPLAIELAAARSRLLSPAELRRRLAHPLDTLVGGARDAPVRQRTMRATIEWSEAALDAGARRTLAVLGSFEGPFDLDSAEALAGGLDSLQTLVDHHLLRPAAGADSAARFVLHPAVRDFARERLAASGEELDARRGHAALFLARAERAATEIGDVDQVSWLDRFDADHADLLASLAFWIEHGDAEQALRLAAALKWPWFMRGFVEEGRRALRAALTLTDAAQHARAYPTALDAAGWLAMAAGDVAAGADLARRSIGLFRTLEDDAGLAWALTTLGFAMARAGDAGAESPFAESLALFRRQENRFGMSFGLSMIGFGTLADDALVEEALALSRSLGDAQGVARCLVLLSWSALDRNDARRARQHVGELVALSALLRHPYLIAYALEVAATFAERRGDAVRCIRLAAAAGAVRDRARVAAAVDLRQRFEHAVARASAAMAQSEREAACRDGAAMSDAQMLAEARRVAGATSSRPVGPVALTPREIEVLRLVGEGLTDAVIAGQLHVSVRTVNAHLRAVYTKLGVSSRAAATRIAATEGLLT